MGQHESGRCTRAVLRPLRRRDRSPRRGRDAPVHGPGIRPKSPSLSGARTLSLRSQPRGAPFLALPASHRDRHGRARDEHPATMVAPRAAPNQWPKRFEKTNRERRRRRCPDLRLPQASLPRASGVDAVLANAVPVCLQATPVQLRHSRHDITNKVSPDQRGFGVTRFD
jgi:hypothetical protein